MGKIGYCSVFFSPYIFGELRTQVELVNYIEVTR